MKKMITAIAAFLWPGFYRQRDQIDQSREEVVGRAMVRLRAAVEHNNRESDIFEKLICDLRDGQC